MAELRARGVEVGCLTVAASDKGSYKETDILHYLERTLEPWTEGRRWRIILLDAYSRGANGALTVHVKRF